MKIKAVPDVEDCLDEFEAEAFRRNLLLEQPAAAADQPELVSFGRSYS